MKTVLAAALAGALISSPAMAWGDREQGVLAGVVGTLILQDIHRKQQPVVVQQPTQTVIIQNDNSWQSTRVCSEQIIRRPDGSQSTLQMNCAGRVVGEIIYNRY